MSDAALDATDFAGESASETLDHLTGRDEPVGEAARAYLDTIALRLAGGYDIADPCVIELPEMVLGPIWAAQDAVGSDASDDWVEAAGRVRGAVPEEHRERFDELLGEARLCNRLRDERGI